MGVGYQPQRDYRVVMVLYFVCFIIIGYFFIINLFVGIILDKFAMEHKVCPALASRLFCLCKHPRRIVCLFAPCSEATAPC